MEDVHDAGVKHKIIIRFQTEVFTTTKVKNPHFRQRLLPNDEDVHDAGEKHKIIRFQTEVFTPHRR